MAVPQSPPGSRSWAPADGHPRPVACFPYPRPMVCPAPLSGCIGDRLARVPLLPTLRMSHPARPGKHLGRGPQGRWALSVSRRIGRDPVCTSQPASRAGSAPPTVARLAVEFSR